MCVHLCVCGGVRVSAHTCICRCMTMCVHTDVRRSRPWLSFTLTFIYLLTPNRQGTTDDFTISFLHFSLFSTTLWNFVNSRPAHSLMLSSHLFFCLPPPFTAPCRPDELETYPHHFSLRLFTIVRRSLCGPIVCWILTQTSSYRMHSILP